MSDFLAKSQKGGKGKAKAQEMDDLGEIVLDDDDDEEVAAEGNGKGAPTRH